jgi:hypothetical protein
MSSNPTKTTNIIFDTDAEVRQAVVLLRTRLLEFKAERNIDSLEGLAQAVGIPFNSFRYADPGNKVLPSPKNLERLERGLPNLTEQDMRTLKKAMARSTSLSRSQASKTRRGESGQPASQPPCLPAPFLGASANVAESQATKVADLDRVKQATLLLMAETGEISEADPVSILLSMIDDRYDIGEMPAILQSSTFGRIDAGLWPPEYVNQLVGYANFLLEEMRRCLLVVAQITPDEVREELLERLSKNLGQFWPAYRAASSVAPHEYVRPAELQEAMTADGGDVSRL